MLITKCRAQHCVIYTPLLLLCPAHTSEKEVCVVGMFPSFSPNPSWALEVYFLTQSYNKVFLWALLTRECLFWNSVHENMNKWHGNAVPPPFVMNV